jgi:hypothetical protein
MELEGTLQDQDKESNKDEFGLSLNVLAKSDTYNTYQD